MATIRPEVTGHAVGEHFEPLAVSPREACRLLSIGNTYLYRLIAERELDSYRDGRARRITMESIRRRIGRLLAAAGVTSATTEAAPRGRGRPHKVPLSPKATP